MCVIFSDVGPSESILRLAMNFQWLLMQFKYHNDYLIGDKMCNLVMIERKEGI